MDDVASGLKAGSSKRPKATPLPAWEKDNKNPHYKECYGAALGGSSGCKTCEELISRYSQQKTDGRTTGWGEPDSSLVHQCWIKPCPVHAQCGLATKVTESCDTCDKVKAAYSASKLTIDENDIRQCQLEKGTNDYDRKKEARGSELLELLDVDTSPYIKRERALELINAGATLEMPGEEATIISVLTTMEAKYAQPVVLRMIEKDVNVNVKDSAGNTPIMIAINKTLKDRKVDPNSRVDYEALVINNLLEGGAEYDVMASDGSTPLSLACTNGLVNIVTEIVYFIIVRKGKDIRRDMVPCAANIPNFATIVEEAYLLRRAVEFNEAVNANDVAKATRLFDMGLNLGAVSLAEVVSKLDITPELHTLIKSMLKKGVDVNLPDKNGLTPLMLFSDRECAYPFDDIMNMLLIYGANVNMKDLSGNTAIYYFLIGSEMSQVKRMDMTKLGAAGIVRPGANGTISDFSAIMPGGAVQSAITAALTTALASLTSTKSDSAFRLLIANAERPFEHGTMNAARLAYFERMEARFPKETVSDEDQYAADLTAYLSNTLRANGEVGCLEEFTAVMRKEATSMSDRCSSMLSKLSIQFQALREAA